MNNCKFLTQNLHLSKIITKLEVHNSVRSPLVRPVSGLLFLTIKTIKIIDYAEYSYPARG